MDAGIPQRPQLVVLARNVATVRDEPPAVGTETIAPVVPLTATQYTWPERTVKGSRQVEDKVVAVPPPIGTVMMAREGPVFDQKTDAPSTATLPAPSLEPPL